MTGRQFTDLGEQAQSHSCDLKIFSPQDSFLTTNYRSLPTVINTSAIPIAKIKRTLRKSASISKGAKSSLQNKN